MIAGYETSLKNAIHNTRIVQIHNTEIVQIQSKKE